MSPGAWTPDMCTCGHAKGQHRSGGVSFPHPPRYGVCVECNCVEFEDVVTADLEVLADCLAAGCPGGDLDHTGRSVIGCPLGRTSEECEA